MGWEKPPRDEAGQQTQEREMIEWLRLSFSFGQSDFCLALSCIDWAVPAPSLFSSPLFSSLLSFLLFYSPLFSSPLSVDLVATSLSHCSLSLSLRFCSLPLSLYLVGLVASSLPRSLSLLYWLGGCFHLLCGLGGFSFFLLCWLDYISSLCLSLSLFSLWF